MISSLSNHSQSMARTASMLQNSKLSPMLLSQLLRRCRNSAAKQANAGFTLVELLVVVVILGVLSAVGIPAYFAQVSKAKISASNAAVLAAAKSCAAAQVTQDQASFAGGSGLDATTITCPALGTAVTFRSSSAAGGPGNGLTTQASATVSTNGDVTFVTAVK